MTAPGKTAPDSASGRNVLARAGRRAGAAEKPLAEAGRLFLFGVAVVWSAVRHPLGYWGDVRDDMFDALKLTWLPMIVSTTAFYCDNLIATPGAVVANGTRTDVSQVGCDGFVIGGTTDHITPWDACYRSARRLPGKASYFTNSDRPDIANEWKTGAEKVSGRWWPHWMEWLSARAGEQCKAPAQPGGRTYPALEAAPGTYVFG